MQIPQAQRPASLRFRFFRSVGALILREMTTTYGRTPGGYLWAILEPVAGIAVLSIAFSYFMRSPGLGTNFPYFYASGYLIFGLFNSTSRKMAGAIRFSRSLLEYPAVNFVDALVARLVLNMLNTLLVMAVVFGGIVIIYGLNPILRWPDIFLALAMVSALGIGIGMVNCYLATILPLWDQVWSIVTRPLFLVSGVFFLPESLPAHIRDVMMWNPLAHCISQFRKGLFVTYDAAYAVPLYPLGLGLGLTLLGLLLLWRYYSELIER